MGAFRIKKRKPQRIYGADVTFTLPAVRATAEQRADLAPHLLALYEAFEQLQNGTPFRLDAISAKSGRSQEQGMKDLETLHDMGLLAIQKVDRWKDVA